MTSSHRPVATLATVAAVAGVSRQTVSNALNNPELLRPDTLARVQEAIDELGYRPNRAARNLRTRASHLIGLRIEPTVEGAASGLMDRFLHSLVESCKEAGLHVLLFTAEDVEDPLDGYDALLRSAAVDAFVVTDTYRGNPQAAWLEARQVPFVAFGRPWEDPQACFPWVDVDGRAGVRLAVDHLADRGHERIAWVGWQKSSYIGEDRRNGWLDRMHERELSTTRLSARGEDTIEFGDAGLDARIGPAFADKALNIENPARDGTLCGARADAGGGRFLDDRVPLAAGFAAALPAIGHCAAVLADEGCARTGHARV